jgi:hypothetical protein
MRGTSRMMGPDHHWLGWCFVFVLEEGTMKYYPYSYPGSKLLGIMISLLLCQLQLQLIHKVDDCRSPKNDHMCQLCAVSSWGANLPTPKRRKGGPLPSLLWCTLQRSNWVAWAMAGCIRCPSEGLNELFGIPQWRHMKTHLDFGWGLPKPAKNWICGLLVIKNWFKTSLVCSKMESHIGWTLFWGVFVQGRVWRLREGGRADDAHGLLAWTGQRQLWAWEVVTGGVEVLDLVQFNEVFDGTCCKFDRTKPSFSPVNQGATKPEPFNLLSQRCRGKWVLWVLSAKS